MVLQAMRKDAFNTLYLSYMLKMCFQYVANGVHFTFSSVVFLSLKII